MREKISTGLNDRPVDTSISQTAPGLPDDSSSLVNVSEEEVERARDRLQGNPREKLKKEVEEAIKPPSADRNRRQFPLFASSRCLRMKA